MKLQARLETDAPTHRPRPVEIRQIVCRSGRILLLAGLISLVVAGSGCASTKPSAETEESETQRQTESESDANAHQNLNATLWMQSSAEYRALTVGVWRQALRQLDRAMDDPQWTAALEQEDDENLEELPPAVIVDVDETVLDNSAFQARLVRNDTQFSTELWRKWCRERQAPPVPGALGFAKHAADRGVTVFYVTNRGHEVEPATRDNLRKHGFPLYGDRDVILTQGEREGWSSDKTTRREFIADSHRILLLVGDNLGDFMGETERSPNRRIGLARDHKDKWGDKWFVLPNPTYGDWEAASYDYNYELSPKNRNEQKRRRLETRSGDSEESSDE